MEWIFTLPYSEYEVINQLQKYLKKSNGYSCYVPTSRQQKGIDFIIHNNKTNEILRIQVKGSRSFSGEPKEMKSGKIKYKYSLRFNNFISRYEDDNADYYLLFWLYPVYDVKKNIKSKADFRKTLILCFSEKEMKNYLKKIKTKKEKKEDSFFWFGFNTSERVFWTRWLEWNEDVSEFLLENKIEEIIDKLK